MHLNNSEIYLDDSCIFRNYEVIFPQSLRHIQHSFANVD
jgi:hypothetical protein